MDKPGDKKNPWDVKLKSVVEPKKPVAAKKPAQQFKLKKTNLNPGSRTEHPKSKPKTASRPKAGSMVTKSAAAPIISHKSANPKPKTATKPQITQALTKASALPISTAPKTATKPQITQALTKASALPISTALIHGLSFSIMPAIPKIPSLSVIVSNALDDLKERIKYLSSLRKEDDKKPHKIEIITKNLQVDLKDFKIDVVIRISYEDTFKDYFNKGKLEELLVAYLKETSEDFINTKQSAYVASNTNTQEIRSDSAVIINKDGIKLEKKTIITEGPVFTRDEYIRVFKDADGEKLLCDFLNEVAVAAVEKCSNITDLDNYHKSSPYIMLKTQINKVNYGALQKPASMNSIPPSHHSK